LNDFDGDILCVLTLPKAQRGVSKYVVQVRHRVFPVSFTKPIDR
jgi:hypothetical protein